MESLVSKALAKYFKKFIKDFKSEQFSISLMKGTAKLTDLELDGAFIQHVMMIPPNTEIRSCSCNELSVNLPGMTKFNEKPVLLTLDKVYLNLEEPETIQPLPERKKSHKKKGSLTGSPLGNRAGLNNIIRDMKIVINEAHFAVKLLPRDEPNATDPWRPHLKFDLYNVVIESTDGHWQVAKLQKTVVKDSEKKIETSFKLALCRSLSIALVSEKNPQHALQIVDKLPVEIHVTTVTSTSSRQTLGVDLYCILDEVHFSWNQISWGLIVKLFSAVRFCLEREIPPAIKKDTKEKIKKQKKKVSVKLDNMEMTYRLLVRTYSMAFLTNIEGENRSGYIFAGRNLHFNIAPKKQIGTSADPLFESKLNLSAESFTFGDVLPNPAIDKRVNQVFSQMNRLKDTEFVTVEIRHRWAKINEPKSTKLNINISGLQLVFDREVLRGFYKFLSSDIFTVAKQDNKRAKQLKQLKKVEKAAEIESKEKEKEQQIEDIISKIKPPKMSDYFYWFNSSDVSITVDNTSIIFPRDYYVRPDGIKLDRELRTTAKKVSFINLAEWNSVPRLAESLKSLERSDLLSFVLDDKKKSNKFQLDISDVFTEISNPETGSFEPILLPTTMKVSGRFLEKVEGIDVQPDLELAIYASQFELTITEEQEAFFKQMIPMYQRWYHKLDKEIKSVSDKTKKGIKAKLDEGRKTALTVASKLAEKNETASNVITKAKTNRMQAVEDAIKSFQCAIAFQASLGSLKVPLHNIGDEPEAEKEEGEEKAIEKKKPETPIPLGEFTFKRLSFVVENTSINQAVEVKLGSFEARNLDHPKSPSALSLLPLSGASDFLDAKNVNAYVMQCQRIRPLSEKPFTNVMVFLQGMQIVSQAKRSAIKGIHKDLEAAIPDLKRIGQKITDTLVGLKEDKEKVDKISKGVDKVKKRMNKGVDIAGKTLDFLDLSWSFNVSDCELVLLDNDWTPDCGKKPFGCIKVASFNQEQLSKRFTDLSNELATAKTQLALSESGVDGIAAEKRAQKMELDKLKKELDAQKKKAKSELEALEQELINAKMSLVQAQVEIEDLQHKLSRKK